MLLEEAVGWSGGMGQLAPVPKLGPVGSALQIFSQLPQTQQDIQQMSKAVQYAQTPQFQQQVHEIKSDVETFVYAQLALQFLATAAVFGMFLITFNKFLKEKKPNG